MSNMAKEDFAALSEKIDWSLFDRVFISGEVGMRKPDPFFFQHVLSEVGLTPAEVIFVDDKEENVLSAQALGIRSLLFGCNTVRSLQTLLDIPISKGYKFLYQNAERFDSVTDCGISVQDNFARLLILEAAQDQNLTQLQPSCRKTWNFFAGTATLIAGGCFPDDLDTTSLALSVLHQEESEVVKATLDEMTGYMNADGSFLVSCLQGCVASRTVDFISTRTYFDQKKLRTDEVVTANILACFYRFGRGYEFPNTLQYLHDALLYRTYMNGTRYYSSPDCCLGFFARLWQFILSAEAPHTCALEEFGSLLKARIFERIGKEGDALDLAMRVLASVTLGTDCKEDCKALLRLQCKDGGWEGGWLYRYGSTGKNIGNRGVTTALAVKAILQSENATRAAGTQIGYD